MPKQKYSGIIDLGTNTFHLLIARYDKQLNYEILERRQIPVKIGKGGIQNNQITNEAYQRGMNALCEFKKVIDGYALEELRIIGTSALRSAKNSKNFLDDIENLFRHGVQLIEGEEEAKFIYYGVSMVANLEEEPVLILDIGGGSVELILGNKNKMLWKDSFEIGAARLIAQFPHDFPIKGDQIDSIKEHIAEVLKPFQKIIKQYPVQSLIGASGSFETFFQLEQNINKKENEKAGYSAFHQINANNFKEIENKILNATKQELYQMPGMVEFRVDMIVAATLIVDYIQNLAEVDQLFFSDYAMKEGALRAFFNEEI